MTDFPDLTVASRAELREWLARNHDRSGSIWLATYKAHHPDHLPWGEVVEELLCWGWVDAVVRRVDADRSAHRVAPRRETSTWSAVNKRLVAKARATGAMTPAGEARIAAARANGMWAFLDDVEAGIVPEDLDAALGDLRAVWDDWPRSVTRGTLGWIKSAKTAPTRAKRIADVVESAGRGLRPSPFRGGTGS
ncbi:YdeI/OmpD-associated family protein [Jannaschia sp. S6380]|uniref:YdeI/OmpD-associated family protein n=1 Tax=Jannaschia sp. S6380 TaxID=2926408 RepID=UPI001FF66474|nr:YdeI/OmpD-associated family protein [Jannaschia sp. S6380]MCK0168214.1 YdeI/OmpD-associated family protein [Jannaschia sp. S6380]